MVCHADSPLRCLLQATGAMAKTLHHGGISIGPMAEYFMITVIFVYKPLKHVKNFETKKTFYSISAEL
jgi:hypothetical protein